MNTTKDTGVVKFWGTQGYGFIFDDRTQRDIFLHVSELKKIGLREVEKGQRIAYDIETRNGKYAAINIFIE